MADALPTWDDALSGAAAPAAAPKADALPSWDDAVKAQTTPGPFRMALNAGAELAGQAGAAEAGAPVPQSSPMTDQFLAHTAVGRVLDAFGHGALQGWGTQSVGMSPDTEEFMRKAGIFNDYQSGQHGLVKSINEALMRPAAAAADVAMRAGSAGFGAYQTGIAQAGAEAGQPALGRDLAALPEAFMAGQHEFAPPAPLPAVGTVEGSLAQARSLGVIGEGDGGYFDTSPREPETMDARAAAIKQHAENLQADDASAPTAAGMPDNAPPTPPDAHEIARQIAPQTFEEYDAIDARRDEVRGLTQSRIDARHQDIADQFAPKIEPAQQKVDDLQRQLDGFQKAGNDKKAATFAGRLDKAQSALDDVRSDMTDAQDAAAQEERAATAQDLQAMDFRMRDLAPDVSDAYRQAQDHLDSGTPLPETGAESVQAAEPASPESESAPVEPAQAVEPQQDAIAPEPAQEQPTIAAGSIASDVSDQLVSSGRPKEEADATAAVVQAYYETRAGRFGGDLGSAENLYRAEGPQVVGADAGGPKGLAKGATVQGSRVVTLFKRADASTFMHETGHMWLEDMMRDAADDRAPDDLKADAQGVRAWLGADEGATITRGQHEKFARGFERYLMEGRAPSEGLARVFQQFKAWLTQIYRSVGRLKSPINDDIRDVFDRMLTTEPKRTVIAPERDISKNFADIHEEEARTATPEHAAPAADAIDREVERIVAEQKQELTNDLTGGQTDGEPAQDAGPAGGANAAELEPAGSEPAAEPRAVAAGGDGAPSEGADVGAAAGEPSRPSARGPATEPPASPNAGFQRGETRFIDKAGNIRLDNLRTPEDVNEAMRQEAEANGDFYAARRGVVTDQEVLDLSEAMGVDAREINIQRLRDLSVNDDIPLAVRVRAGRKMLVDAATKYKDMVRDADPNNPADVSAYIAARNRFSMIMETVAGATAEIGRAMRAFQDLGAGAIQEAKALGDYVRESTGKTLYQIQAEMKLGKHLDTPAKVAGFLRDATAPTRGDMIQEAFVNWLISGPITHMTYSIGNSVAAYIKATVETAAAAGIADVRELATGEKLADRVHWGEINAQVFGRMRGQRDAWRAAWDSFKAGQTMALPGENVAGAIEEIASRMARDEGLKNEARTARIDELKRAPTPEMQTEAQAVVGDAIAAVQSNVFTQRKAIPGKLGTIVRFPGERMVAPLHSLGRSLAYSQEIARLAYRDAANAGLQGQEMSLRIAELTRSPTREMMQAARGEATSATLMGKGGDFTQKVNRLLNHPFNLPILRDTKLLRFIDPFTTISANVMDQAVIQRGLPGLLKGSIRDDIMGKNGAVAQQVTGGRMVAGTSLTALGIGLAAEGLLTPSAPSDPKEAAMSRMVNGAPHSIRIGNLSIEVGRLGYYGMVLSMAADLHEIGHAMSEEDAAKVGGLMIHSFAQNFLDEGFMKGPSDLMRAVEEHDRFGASYVRNFVSTIAVPFSVGTSQIARQIDPYAREARTTLDAIKAKIPFLSETLYPRYDVWGQPVLNHEYAGVYFDRLNQDPTNAELQRLHIFPSKADRKVVGVELTDEQYDEYARTSGRMAKMFVDNFVRQPGYQQIPDAMKATEIHKQIENATDIARERIKMQYPQIRIDAQNNKLLALRH